MKIGIVKKSFLIICLATGCLSAQDRLPKEGQIPILAWGGVPPDKASVERFKELREAGITVSLTRITTMDSMQNMLDMAQKAGLKLLVRCPELKTAPEKTVRIFRKHPAVAGYYLKDEPSRMEFEELAVWAKKVQSVDGKKLCYFNLFPNYAPVDRLGTATYQKYLNDFYTIVPAQMVSFDNYPIIQTKTGRILRKDWYENLEMAAEEAKRQKKPLWTFALTTTHGMYPIPSLGELRLQVYSGLAYGAQAIQYFTFWTPRNKTHFVYSHGPIEGISYKRTEVFDRVRGLNQEIQGLSAVFLGAKMISVGHFGKEIPQGTKSLVLPKGIAVLETDGGALVSVLEKDNYRYVLIVNRDFQKPMQLTVEGESSLKKVLKDGILAEASTYTPTQEVDAGDVAIYRLPR